jgi:7,8-dihydropterin-6-yl-methyl-4-(beta-D-ribofuranosyl)aminobenzene 5'-phosphate synthase
MPCWAGFTSLPTREDYVREVIGRLKEVNPDYVVPMHCTGEPF